MSRDPVTGYFLQKFRRYRPFFEMAKLVEVSVRDVRFPTSRELHGSDAMVSLNTEEILSFFIYKLA